MDSVSNKRPIWPSSKYRGSLFFEQKMDGWDEKYEKKTEKNLDHFSICACHPWAGAMLIFSVSFQFYRISPNRHTISLYPAYI